MRKRDFEYVRHGTTSLFAALVGHSGEVIADVEERNPGVESVGFLDEINHRCPKDRMIHVIADNLAVDKTPEVKAWLARHARFHMHFTPTHASWLNQVELFFFACGIRGERHDASRLDLASDRLDLRPLMVRPRGGRPAPCRLRV